MALSLAGVARAGCYAEFAGSTLVGCSTSDGVVRLWKAEGESHVPMGQFEVANNTKLRKVVWHRGVDHLGRSMVGTLEVSGRAALWVFLGGGSAGWREVVVFRERGATDLESGPPTVPAFAVSAADGVVEIHEQVSHRVEDWDLTATLKCPGAATAVSWDPAGSGLAAGSESGDVLLWRRPNFAWTLDDTRTLGLHIYDVAWAPGGARDDGVPLVAVATPKGIALSGWRGVVAWIDDSPGSRRLFWNNAGSLLAATDEINHVSRVWKRNFQDKWVLLRVYKSLTTTTSDAGASS
mmetsp:Transcript_32427/g.103394  ORF Transcript_32427/g.103394 Transcript_32427/m.103394 type:complete len:294 (-) Transcript_32427:54-935(-)